MKPTEREDFIIRSCPSPTQDLLLDGTDSWEKRVSINLTFLSDHHHHHHHNRHIVVITITTTFCRIKVFYPQKEEYLGQPVPFMFCIECFHMTSPRPLVSQNNETAAMLVSHETNPVGVEFFFNANAFFCSNKFE